MDDLARGEALPGGLVADFRELAYQLFKHQTHLHVADGVWMQVDLRELFCALVQQTRLEQKRVTASPAEPGGSSFW